MKNPLVWPLFFKYFRQFKEKLRPGTFAILAPRLYNRYNHSHVPGQHMWQSLGPGLQVLQNSGSQKFIFRVKTLSRLPLTKFKKKKIIESAAIKKALVSVH